MLLLALPGLLTMVVYVVVFILIVGLVWYLVQNFLPEPLKKFAIAIIVVIAVLILIYFLLSITQGGGLHV